MNTFIGIKKLWYGDAFTEQAAITPDYLEQLIENMTEVTNVHEDTWGYEETDPEISEYINELTGLSYYVDETKQGIPTISFTLGEYEYQQKADLQGGEVIEDNGAVVGWSRPTELSVLYKSVLALSKTGVYILFPKAQITGKGDVQEKNIGLGVQAKAVETGIEGLSAEYWVKKKAYRYTAVENPSGNPTEHGWYIYVKGHYILSEDTAVVEGTTYYTRTLV